MTCAQCEYHKNRAAHWRAEAYKWAGHDVIERPKGDAMDKEELLALLRVCGADPSAIEAVELAFEAGRQQGMKQERALWELAKTSQELDAAFKEATK